MNQYRIPPVAVTGLALCGMLAAGCGHDRADVGANETPTRSPAPVLSPSQPPSPPVRSGVLVSYHRSGGLAGVDDHITVHTDGRVNRRGRTARCALRLDRRELAGLRADLDRAHLAALDSTVRPQRAVDSFAYQVAYRGRTAQVFDTAVPAALQPVLARFNALIRRDC